MANGDTEVEGARGLRAGGREGGLACSREAPNEASGREGGKRRIAYLCEKESGHSPTWTARTQVYSSVPGFHPGH